MFLPFGGDIVADDLEERIVEGEQLNADRTPRFNLRNLVCGRSPGFGGSPLGAGSRFLVSTTHKRERSSEPEYCRKLFHLEWEWFNHYRRIFKGIDWSNLKLL